MEQLDKDRLFLIALELDLPSLLRFCETNKRISNIICGQPHIWVRKLKKDFDYITSQKDYSKAKEIYKIIYTLKNFNMLTEAINFGSLSLVKYVYYYVRGKNRKMLDYRKDEYFIQAVKENKGDIADFFISEGAKAFDAAFLTSVENNNFEMIQKFLKLLKNKTLLNKSLNKAAKNGNVQVVNYLLNNGADDMEEGLQGAAEGGHEELVDFFISKGATNWDLALVDAITGGNKNIISKLISKVDRNYLRYAKRQASTKPELLNLFPK